MSVQLVVARYCEDLSWLSQVPSAWRILIYDKSLGGPRQGIQTSMYKSPDGPDKAPSWPGAVLLSNVGCEAQTYLHHIVHHYGDMAGVTLFVQGNPEQFDFKISQLGGLVGRAAERGFAAAGPQNSCDADGRPHHGEGLPELTEMWDCFHQTAVPRHLTWFAGAQFAVAHERVTSIKRSAWFQARNVCMTKRHACAMERLWYELLGKA